MLSSLVAGNDGDDFDMVYDEDFDDEDWDLNDADSTHGDGIAVCARELRASFMKV